MDIKWKNLIRKWYVKAIAYAIIIICAAIFLTKSWDCAKVGKLNIFNVLMNKEYDQNEKNYLDSSHYAQMLYKVNVEYESEQKIKDGAYTEQRVEQYLQNLYMSWPNYGYQYRVAVSSDEIGSIYEEWYEVEDTVDTVEEEYAQEGYDTKESHKTMEEFLQKNPDLKEDLKEGFIKEQLFEYQDAKESLNNYPDFVGEIITDKEQIKQFESEIIPLYVMYGDYTRNSGRSLKSSKQRSSGLAQINQYIEKEKNSSCIVVGIKKSVLDDRVKEWNEKYEYYKTNMVEMIVLFVITFIMLLFLLAVTGRRPNEEKAHLYKYDGIWSEVQAVLFFWAFVGSIGCISYFYLELDKDSAIVMRFLGVAGIEILGLIMITILLSQVRRLKAKQFINGFITLKWIKKLWRMIVCLWRRGSITKRAMVLAIGLPLICATWIGLPFVLVLLIYVLYKYFPNYLAVCEGASRIRRGELNHKITIDPKQGTLYQLADDINQISQGLDSAISSELKSERLKTELISNVSHDLKTPLTSIISYVDVLKHEDIENEKAKEYIEIIERKAARLSILTNDLFEAAKATSGDMPVQLSRVNLVAIIHQALGEYEEKLSKGEFIIKMNFPEEPAYVNVDGKLTWRIIANLLSNVVKYAQSGSRVYLDVFEEKEQGEYCFVMKNIASYELNIPAEELMERFKRADLSRNTEGSGLGLSIANSLTVLQHGTFEIVVDGDLFKAVVRFKKSEGGSVLGDGDDEDGK